jgi:protein TonB
MKKFYTILILLLIFIANKSNASNFILSDSTIKSDSSNLVYKEEPPEFPGGIKKLMKYIENNLIYPEAAYKKNIQGVVKVSFIVEKDGSVSNPTIISGIGYGCDEEAVRIIASLPRFIPGKQNGNPVRVQYNVPIIYNINNYRKK